MKAAVVGIRQPQLLFVRGQANAVAWTPVPLGWPRLKSLDLDSMQYLAGGEVAHLEAKQLVDIHEAQGALAVDCKRPNNVAEQPHLADQFVSFQVRNAQNRRVQPRQIRPRAVQSN